MFCQNLKSKFILLSYYPICSHAFLLMKMIMCLLYFALEVNLTTYAHFVLCWIQIKHKFCQISHHAYNHYIFIMFLSIQYSCVLLHINGFGLGWCRLCEWKKIPSTCSLLWITNFNDFVAKGGVGFETSELARERELAKEILQAQAWQHQLLL